MQTHDDTAEILRTLKVALQNPLLVFDTMPLITKLGFLIALACGLVVIILAILRRSQGGPPSGTLSTFALIAVLACLAGAAYRGLITYIGVQALHVTRLVVFLPDLIEIAYILVLALVVWLIAQFGNAGAKRA